MALAVQSNHRDTRGRFTMTNLTVKQRIFKELWVVDYMKAYEYGKENGLTDEDMQVVLHELNKEKGNQK